MGINQYDDMLSKMADDELPEVAAPLSGAAKYDAILEEDRSAQKSTLQASMFLAAKREPDRHAQVLELAKKTNLPTDVVERQFDSLSKSQAGMEKRPKYDEIIDSTPGLASWLENPDNASLGHDDLDTLAKVERGVRLVAPKREPESTLLPELGRAGQTGWNNLNSSAWHLAAAYGLASPEDAAQSVAEANRRARDLRAKMPDYAKEFSTAMEVETNDINKAFKRFTGSFEEFRSGSIKQALTDFAAGGGKTLGETIDMIVAAGSRPRGLTYSTVEQLANSLPSLGLGAAGATGGAWAGATATGPLAVVPGIGQALAATGATVGGFAGFMSGSFAGTTATEIGAWINESLAKRGFDMTDPAQIAKAYGDAKLMAEIRGEAERKGLTTATVDSLFNAFAGKLMVGAKGGSTLAKVGAATADVGVQAVGETAGEFGGQLAAGRGDLSKVNFGESLMEGITSLGHSVGDTIIGGSLRKAYSVNPIQAAQEIAKRTRDALQAQQSAQTLHQVGQAVQESKTAARFPDKIKELVDLAGVEGEPTAVYFQADDWDNFWTKKGQSPVQMAEQILGDQGKAYHDAKQTDEVISFPMGSFLSKMAKSPEFDGLLETARAHADGMTFQEAREHLAALPATMEELAKEAAATPQEVTAEGSARTVRQQIEAQLEAAGEDTDQAVIFEQAFKVLGERTGKDPLELFNQYRVKIQKGDADSASTDLNQAQIYEQAILQQDTEAVPGLDMSDEARSQRAEAMGLDTSRVVYHGGVAGIDAFRTNPKGANKYLEGVYMTPSQNEADRYAGMARTGGGKSELYAFYAPKNLLDLDDAAGVDAAIEKMGLEIPKHKPQFKYSPEMDHLTKMRKAVKRALQMEGKPAGEKGVDASLRERLSAAGYKGMRTENDMVTVVFDPKDVRSVKAAFDPAKVDSPLILDQSAFRVDPGASAGGLGKRGSIAIQGKNITIKLAEAKDPSTFFHETGHFFLELMGNIAEEADTPQGIKDDFKVILDWLGVESRADITVEHHEKWARGFEAYLMTSEAPSAALRKAFAKFKVWLISVYRVVKNLNVNLSKDVRSVMDRMLATEEEIEAAQSEQNMEPLFVDPKAMGMTDSQAINYLDAVFWAKETAKETLNKKLMADFNRAKESFWKEELAKEREVVAAEVDQMKVFQTIDKLKTDEMKLSHEGLAEFGKDVWKGLPKGTVVTKKAGGGLDPALAASALGYDSAQSLVSELTNAPSKATLIEKIADERMSERYPDLLWNAKLPEEAMKAAHNQNRSKLLRMELEHLASQDMPVLQDAIRRVARRMPTEKDIRDQAIRTIGKKKVQELNPGLYQRAERKAAKEAGQHLAKGDLNAAFEAKRRELLNHELYRAALDAKESVTEKIASFKKMAKSDEKLAKTRDIDLVNAARAILSKFGIGKVDKTVADYLKPIQKYDPDTYATVSALVESVETEVGNYRESTYDDFVAMSDTVEAIWDLSRTSQQIEIDGRVMDRAIIQEELEARIDELQANKPALDGYARAKSDWEGHKAGLMGLRAATRRVESWADSVDGDSGKKSFTTTIFRKVSDAANRYRDAKKVELRKLLDILSPVKETLGKKDIVAHELKYIFKSRAELLGALLHTGNESNLSKLLRGRGWGSVDSNGVLDRTKWDAFISRMQKEGVLTKQDYDVVQGVWDQFEATKADAQRAHKRMYGYYFNEVTANEFETPFGKYRGGYAPAMVDPNESIDAVTRSDREAMEQGGNAFMFPTAGRGFTKSRVDTYAAPLVMDLRLVPMQLDKVLRFTHIEPHVKEVARLVLDKGFAKKLASIDETISSEMLVPWLQRAATQKVSTPLQGRGGKIIDTFFRTFRSNTGLNTMSLNVVNSLQNFLGLFVATAKVSPRFLSSSLWNYIHSPGRTQTAISEKSVVMRQRFDDQSSELNRQIEDILIEPSKFDTLREFVTKHGRILQTITQNTVDSVVFSAAYDQAVEQGASEKDAVRAAEAAVRQTQGAMNPEDVSRAETGSTINRAFSLFYGYFNMLGNLYGTESVKIFRDMGFKDGLTRGTYLAVLAYMVPAGLSQVIGKLASGDIDSDDDDEYLDDLMGSFFFGQLRTATALFPFVGPVVNAGIGIFTKEQYDDKISLSPIATAVEGAMKAGPSVYRAAIGTGSKKAAVKDSLTLIGLATGLPVVPIGKPVGYLIDVSEGRARPSGTLDFTRGLVTGKPGGK